MKEKIRFEEGLNTKFDVYKCLVKVSNLGCINFT